MSWPSDTVFHCIIVCLEFSADCHIYLWRKVVCWFCLFACLPHWDLPNYGASCNTLGAIGKSSMSRGALSWFHNGLTYGGQVIEYWIIFIEKLFKSKLKIIGEFGCPLDIVDQWVRFNEGDLEIFRPKVWEIVFIIGNSMKLLKMVLEGKINWVTSSHLGHCRSILSIELISSNISYLPLTVSSW